MWNQIYHPIQPAAPADTFDISAGYDQNFMMADQAAAPADWGGEAAPWDPATAATDDWNAAAPAPVPTDAAAPTEAPNAPQDQPPQQTW